MKITPVELAQRVEAWQQRLGPLGVAHWRIKSVNIVDETPGGPGAQATVQPSYTYDHCTFWFVNEFLDEVSEQELDETIIHEWVHVAMRDLDASIEAAEDCMSPPARQQWEERVGHEREGLVERMAKQIYALYNEKQ